MARRPTMTLEAERLDDPMLEAAQSLGELATQSPNLTVTQERSLFGDIVTAQPIKVARNEADILKRIDILAAGAGTRWFYRYPVKNRRKGTTDYIEGPTIKCTDAVLMRYKNAAVESRTIALPGDARTYVCYSRFCDWENGVSITMGQLVPRSATLGGEDEERRVAIAHNVGQSKSRKVIGDELSKLEVPGIVARVEQVYARKQGDWLAADIASIYAELQGIADGMSSIDETWPLPPPPEPTRHDETTAAAGSPNSNPPGTGGPASSLPPADEGQDDAGSSKE